MDFNELAISPKLKTETMDQRASARSNHSQRRENIEGLVANTPKNNINLIECPPVDFQKKPEIDCNIPKDVKKC